MMLKLEDLNAKLSQNHILILSFLVFILKLLSRYHLNYFNQELFYFHHHLNIVKHPIILNLVIHLYYEFHLTFLLYRHQNLSRHHLFLN